MNGVSQVAVAAPLQIIFRIVYTLVVSRNMCKNPIYACPAFINLSPIFLSKCQIKREKIAIPSLSRIANIEAPSLLSTSKKITCLLVRLVSLSSLNRNWKIRLTHKQVSFFFLSSGSSSASCISCKHWKKSLSHRLQVMGVIKESYHLDCLCICSTAYGFLPSAVKIYRTVIVLEALLLVERRTTCVTKEPAPQLPR